MKFQQQLFDKEQLPARLAMESAYPGSPLERGRSRFSKALPLPPEPPAPRPVAKDNPRAMTSNLVSLHSPLPPIPKDSSPIPKTKSSNMSIPRRPVGAGPSEHSKAGSIGSNSSTYSTSPEFSRSLSNGSNMTKDSLSGIDSEADPTPPLPPKDNIRWQQTPKSTLASPASGFQTTPPRPEIWRRRSVKSDRSIVLPELKLNKSNGSTASPPRQPPSESNLVASQLLRSQGQKPVPARPAPPQPEFGGMGNKLSKLKEKTMRGSSDSNGDLQPSSYPSYHNKRLPTPEYLKSDKQQPITPKLLSPTSPETPPNDDAPPAVPRKSESRGRSPTARVPQTVVADTVTKINLLSSNSRDTSEALTITSEPQVMRSPQPHKAYAAKILTPQPSPPETTDATEKTATLASPVSPLSPNTKLKTDLPNLSTPISPGMILQGPELSIVHFECYHNHKMMRSSKNNPCPVACMVCRKEEMGPRWRCTWCCLGACGSCMKVLTSIPGRDLKVALERVEKVDENSQLKIEG